MKVRFLVLVVSVGALLSSCAGKFIESDVDKTFKENESEILAYASANNLNLTKEANSGLYYQITKTNPTGLVSSTQFDFHVAYTITTLKGIKIDSKTAADSAILNLYTTPVFEGLYYSLLLLKEGEKGKFFIPSYIAYGTNPPANVQNNEVIVAEIELIDLLTEDDKIAKYIKKKGLKITETTSTGLRFIRLNPKVVADSLKTGDVVSVKYSGMFLSESVFDSGTFAYTVGSGTVIKGFSEGLEKLKKGEQAKLVFPSSIGYGVNGNTKIPPYAPLIFDIEILTVNGK